MEPETDVMGVSVCGGSVCVRGECVCEGVSVCVRGECVCEG